MIHHLITLLVTSLYLFPATSPMPGRSIIASHDPRVYLVGLHPGKRFPTSFLEWKGEKIYLDAENSMRDIPGVQRRSVHPDPMILPWLYDNPLRRYRYEEWKEWKDRLEDKHETSFHEYMGLEQSMTRQIEDILRKKKVSIVFMPIYWIVPDSIWSFLSQEERDGIRVLAPLLTETSAFPFGDEIYIDRIEPPLFL